MVFCYSCFYLFLNNSIQKANWQNKLNYGKFREAIIMPILYKTKVPQNSLSFTLELQLQ